MLVPPATAHDVLGSFVSKSYCSFRQARLESNYFWVPGLFIAHLKIFFSGPRALANRWI
jgi:hypothetical protein